MKKNEVKNIQKNIFSNIKIGKIILFLFIIFIKSPFSLSIIQKDIHLRKLDSSNIIILTVKGPGTIKILNDNYNYPPDEIDIEGNKIQYSSNSVELEEEENIVKLYYNTSPENLKNMFKGLQNINKIDLSNFDTSDVRDMSFMFSECLNLKEINMNGIDTSSVTNMQSMFRSCQALTSLDLSNFNTFLVEQMDCMFCSCQKMEFLDVSSFDTSKVTDMSYMFSNCQLLKSIDISNFEMNDVNIYAMFKTCHKVKSIKFSQTNRLVVNNLGTTFQDCKSLTSIDLSNFEFSKNKAVTNVNYLFDNCYQLITIKFPNIDVSTIIDFSNMFSYCSNLQYLDLSMFNITNPKNMDGMFLYCNSLKYLNIKNFYLTTQTSLNEIFENIPEGLKICYNEESAHIFESLNKNLINNCEDNCFSSLSKLIKESKTCVNSCNETETYKFEYNNICYNNCPSGTTISEENEFLCIEEAFKCENYYNKLKTKCYDFVPDGYFICDEDEKIIDKCDETCKTCRDYGNATSNNCLTCRNGYFFYDGNCLLECPYGYYKDVSGKKVCTCLSNSKCKECYENEQDNSICISCNEGYYQIYDESIILSECYKEINGYYLDEEDLFFKKCYNSCKTCTKKGNETNHNCVTCIYNYDFISEKNKEGNCYKKCDYFYYFKTENEYVCTNTDECPSTHSKKVVNKNKCIDQCINDDDYPYEYYNQCYDECPENMVIENNICKEKTIDEEETDVKTEIEKTTEIEETDSTTEIKKTTQIEETDVTTEVEKTEKVDNTDETTEKENIIDKWSSENFFLGLYNTSSNTLEKDDIIENIREDIIKENLNDLISQIIKEKDDKYIISNKTLYQITTSENQNNNVYTNISSINLGDCEDILKEEYKINKNDTLIILKIDYNKEGLLIPIIGYEVYHPYYKYKLNLSYCNESSIVYNIPVTINEDELYKYDPTSEYYTDECNTYTTENGTDIILNDRKNEFTENNMSLCENICNYVGYDEETKKAICECGIKYKDFVLSEIENESNLLSNNLTTDNSTLNLATMKCTELLFSKEGLLTNIGNYILACILIIHLISIIIFYKCGKHIIETNINDILSQKKKLLKLRKTSKSKTNIFHLNHKIKNLKKKKKINPNKSSYKKKSTKGNPSKKLKSKSKITKSTKSILHKENSNISVSDNKSINKMVIKEKNITFFDKRKIKTPNKSIDNTKIIQFGNNHKILNINLLLYDDYELNTLDYKESIKIDKRTLCQIYVSLIKTKHPIVFSFFPIKDYNVMIMKICIFFLSFAIIYAINGIFFDLKIIHQIYIDEGNYNLSYLFPIIFYSFFISYIIIKFIKYASLSERNLLLIKGEKSTKEAKGRIKSVKRCIIIKTVLYFIMSIAFIGFFWYYISSFGAVYQNSQIFLIKNTFISFFLDLSFPLIINIIPAFFKKLSLGSDNRECIYKFSVFLLII